VKSYVDRNQKMLAGDSIPKELLQPLFLYINKRLCQRILTGISPIKPV